MTIKFFHPYLVHFPVAFLVLELFLLILWATRKQSWYPKAASLVLKCAVFVMPFVMISGLIDARGLPPRVQTHFTLAVILLVVTLARLMLTLKFKFRGEGVEAPLWMDWFLTIVNVACVVVTAHFGGKLVYF